MLNNAQGTQNNYMVNQGQNPAGMHFHSESLLRMKS